MQLGKKDEHTSNYWAERGKLRAMCGESNLDVAKPDEDTLEYVCNSARFNCGERTDCILNWINGSEESGVWNFCGVPDAPIVSGRDRYNLMITPNDYGSAGDVTGVLDYKQFANCIMFCSYPKK